MKNVTIKNAFLLQFLPLLATLLITLVIGVYSVKWDHTTSESSLIELCQAGFMLFASAICFVQRKKSAHLPLIFTILSAFFAVIFIREMDYHIELYFPHGAWKYPALLIMALTGVFAWKNRQALVKEINVWINLPQFHTWLLGFLIVFVFSRLAGMNDFWQSFLADNYMRDIKNLVEEGLELLGYALMLNAALFFVILDPRVKQSQTVANKTIATHG
ncbi:MULTISPECIES: hypothetical protein [unclassified Vibrio]|uniref:Intracellular septation protein A n=1 Tax=Vibrio sp. HB236076 TaxID=3232307 RepID=A0AB39HI81_9VIBR|nr:hypothetical protein [Vibrio sp. HB161653]MDP5252711.1 hypothetical protein [Vibrio sp. HB161653]